MGLNRAVKYRLRLVGRLSAVAGLCLVGCGIFTVIPMDDVRLGNPAGRFFAMSHPPYASREVLFSHEIHTDFACDRCHAAGTSAETPHDDVRAGGLPTMARCLECHDGETAASACEVCHQLQRRDLRPPSHDATWQRRHGRQAREELYGYQCALCHTEDGCQSCHAVRKPQSHTLRFLRSAHGRAANHDRGACAVCHEADFCQNCHSQPPPDHTPAFTSSGGHKDAARLRTRSCLTCHQFQDTCQRCHA